MEETEMPVSVSGSEPAEDTESEEVSDSFLCCVCLELLYKPVVLSCGHISCFWCVHKSMNGARESHCPICRRPYIHFPSICKMLHFLLVKMYPNAYSRRQKQILEEERRMHIFSPEFDASEWHGTMEAKTNAFTQSCMATTECSSSANVASSRDVNIQEENAAQVQSNENVKQISRSDLLCVSCKQLVFRPSVLNCGHVYCKSCLITPANEKLKCQVCQSIHPGELPSVCWELDHFLDKQFPEQYTMKKGAAEAEGGSSCSESSKAGANGAHKDDDRKSLLSGKVHFGVGCDYCGMHPIIGDRYRCTDCTEKIGFDLCGECYNSQSKLPGRFNQQHKPEHKFQLVQPNAEQNYMLRLMLGFISSSGNFQSENAQNALTPRVILPPEVPEGSELDVLLPSVFEAIVEEEDQSETEATT